MCIKFVLQVCVSGWFRWGSNVVLADMSGVDRHVACRQLSWLNTAQYKLWLSVIIYLESSSILHTGGPVRNNMLPGEVCGCSQDVCLEANTGFDW